MKRLFLIAMLMLATAGCIATVARVGAGVAAAAAGDGVTATTHH